MEKRRRNLLTLGFVLLFCPLSLLTGCGSKPEKAVPNIPDTVAGERVELVSTHPSFVTGQELNAYLPTGGQEKAAVNGRIVSAVVPHHLVAGALIADVIRHLVPQKPDLIVLVGPNHPNRGAKIITGCYGWQTPNGIVQADAGIVNLLVGKGAAEKDEQALENEHAIGAIVPFIRYYLPQARIVPIILHHDVSLEEVKRLLKTLEPSLNQNTVLISSVDFSHYLTRSQAQAKDRETLRVMKNFDYPTLFRLGSDCSDYLDSPASLSAAFLLAQKNGITDPSVLANTNSGIILQNDFIETTSYFTLLFTLP